MIKTLLYWGAVATLAAILATNIVKADTLPQTSEDIAVVWLAGKLMESATREKLRSELTPTPMQGPNQYIGVNIDPCVAPDGFLYGINWPVFSEEEKIMWEHVLASQPLEKQRALFNAMINGTKMLWDIAGFSEEEKDNILTRMLIIERDCFPEPVGNSA